jgi:hypothetical protein
MIANRSSMNGALGDADIARELFNEIGIIDQLDSRPGYPEGAQSRARSRVSLGGGGVDRGEDRPCGPDAA